MRVRHIWLIDPLAKTLEVFRLSDGQWIRAAASAGDEKVRVEPFEVFELELGALWGHEAPEAGP